MRKLLLLFITLPLFGQQDQVVSLQINPVTMTALDQMTGLKQLGAGLWNGVIRNSSTSTIKVTWADVQLAFPQVNFMTSMETSLLLTRQRNANIWTIIYNLFKDAMVGAAALYSPWFLVAQPILNQVDPQIAALRPNVAALLGQLSTTSFTLAPSDTAIIVMLASKMPASAVHSYRHDMVAEPQPMVQPPALLRELPAARTAAPDINAPTATHPVVSWESGLDYVAFAGVYR